MQMLGIALVRTLRRLRIKFQRRIVEFLVSDFAGVETSHRELAHQRKELAPVFFARAGLVFEPERIEQGSLLFGSELDEFLAKGALAMCVQPCQTAAKRILRLGIARHHEVDE